MSRTVLDRDLCVALGRWPVLDSDVQRLRRAIDGRGAAPIREALHFARENSVEPLAIAVLHEAVWEWLPTPLQQQLEQHRRASLAYSGVVVRTLVDTLQRFAAAGLHPLAFKGPVMAQRLFGHRGRRPGGDIDLLLPTEEIEPAVQLLIGDGRYVPRPPFHLPDVRATARAVTVDPAVATDRLPEFDLHRSFAVPWVCDLSPRTVFDHAQPVELAGATVQSVDDPLGALQGAIHLAAGGYCWKQAVDLAGWDRVLTAADRVTLQRLARAAGCEGITLHGFELVRAVFGDPEPHAAPPLPSPSPTARARAALLRELGAVPAALFTPSPLRTGYVRTLVRNLAADRRSHALAAMARAVVTPNPSDRDRPGAAWRRPWQIARRLLASFGRTA